MVSRISSNHKLGGNILYTILDPDLQTCGVLDLQGKGCKFYEDIRSTKFADDQGKIWGDTLSISVPYGYRETEYMTQGYHLLKEGDNGKFYCYRIYDWSDAAIGPIHVKKVQAINLLAYDLIRKIVPAKELKAVNSNDAFDYILQQSGWEIGDNDFFGGVKDLPVSAGNNAQYWLDQLTSIFEVEIDAYVEMYNGAVFRKLVDIVEELGESNGRRLEYSHDLKGLTRTGNDSQLYTKLYVYGGNDKNNNPISITSVNAGKEYIVDEDANDLYNNGGPYLEGHIVNDKIFTPTGLLEWGKRQLAKMNHPKYTYNVDVAYLGYKPNLGDYIQVVDFSMEPELTISARVIQLDESEANPNNDKVILGEFVEVVAITPGDIWALQAKASQAQQAAEAARTYQLEYFTPDGMDFADVTSTKRIIIRVLLGTENVTEKIDPSDFSWQKINADGTHDLVWEEAHAGLGNIITVGEEVSGCIIRCEVNTDDGTITSTLYADETDAAYFATLQMEAPEGWTDYTKSVAQYAQVDSPRGHIYWSQDYTGSKQPAGSGSSYVITRTDLTGTPIDRMWVIRGGHGAQFGIEYISSKMWIWSYYLDTTKNEWHVVKFPYTPNKVLTWGDSSIVDLLNTTTKSYRTNIDNRNGYLLFVEGVTNPVFTVCKKSDILAKTLKPIYSMKGSDVNFFGKEQVYQSACLDFPYVYFTSGGSTDETQKILWCVDIRSKSLVYRIVYTFDKGTIEDIADHSESEAISVYYDSNDKKWLIQGFAFGNEDIESSQRTNQLFRINEHKRGDA